MQRRSPVVFILSSTRTKRMVADTPSHTQSGRHDDLRPSASSAYMPLHMSPLVRASGVLFVLFFAVLMTACSENGVYDDVERGTFVLVMDGLISDTVRGDAYVREIDSAAPGIELDAQATGWSLYWTRPFSERTEYAILPAEWAGRTPAADKKRPDAEEASLPAGAIIFMQHPVHGEFEAESGTVTIEHLTDTDVAGHVYAEMAKEGDDPVLTIEGRWHAQPAPATPPPHLQP